ncbi:MAG TPA: TetR/AcrR family transcriptional regulator [Myxococcota bacterium]|nr:TetR/AcrR family transcriptional regulator [Myxococcota bacterium]
MTPESHASLRQKILDEALGLVASEGVGGVTMRALAHKLGYSPATIYLYFRNKDDLFQEIARYGNVRLMQATEGCSAIADAAAARDEFLRIVVDFAFQNPRLYQIMCSVDLLPFFADRNLEEPGRRVGDRYRDIYVRGVAAGELATPNPEHDLIIDWSMIYGFITLVLTGQLPHPRLPDASVSELRDVVLDAIRRRTAPAPP